MDALSRSTTRAILQSLLGIQGTLEKLQARLDQADIAIEAAVEDPAAFVRTPMALKNLDTAMRSVTGLCDNIIGHLGMVHHTVKETGLHPGPTGLYRMADRVAMRWLASKGFRYYFTVLASGTDNPFEAERKLAEAARRFGWRDIEIHDERRDEHYGEHNASERQAFNKFNPSELLGQLKRVLLDAGLDEVWQQIEVAKVPRLINDAWQNRERT